MWGWGGEWDRQTIITLFQAPFRSSQVYIASSKTGRGWYILDVVWDNETIAVQRFEIASYAEQKNCFPEVNVQYSFFQLARLFLVNYFSL